MKSAMCEGNRKTTLQKEKATKPIILWLVSLTTLATLYVLFLFSTTSDNQENLVTSVLKEWFSKQPNSPQPSPARYTELKQEIERKRLSLAQRYLAQTEQTQQDLILQEAQALLHQTLPKLMRCWLGTPWDYNGTATTPGEGTIACGYFVSTVLRDAGFRLERVKLSQQASQSIIATFLPRSEMDIQVGMNYSDYVQRVKDFPAGIHIVGLDNHVAFIVTAEDQLESFRFIHSSGANPKKVVDQDEHSASALQNSRYRVIGNLTNHKEVLRKWLLGEPFHTQLTN